MSPSPGSAESASFLTARWLQLVMANFEVDRQLLDRLVPAGTRLDLWRGRCFVSVVGFQFVDTRVLGLSIPFHRHFDEVNLRFYVERLVDGETRRGVVFVREIVPRWTIAAVANAVYNEKYVALAMTHDDSTATSSRMLTYSWRYQGRWCRLSATLDGDAYLPDVTSEEAFITEHYWGYAVQRDGSTREYQVEHPRWNVWRGINPELVCDVAALYGSSFAPFLESQPSSCFIADGSAVVVRRGLPLSLDVSSRG